MSPLKYDEKFLMASRLWRRLGGYGLLVIWKGDPVSNAVLLWLGFGGLHGLDGNGSLFRFSSGLRACESRLTIGQVGKYRLREIVLEPCLFKLIKNSQQIKIN